MDRQDAKTPRKEPSAEVDSWARAVVDAAFEVHATLGPGHDEMVYENALCIELEMRGIPFARQPVTLVEYKGHAVGEGRLDLLVGGQLIVELKAVAGFAPVHTAQVLAYLKVTSRELALLINFNVPRIKEGIRRIVRTQHLP